MYLIPRSPEKKWFWKTTLRTTQRYETIYTPSTKLQKTQEKQDPSVGKKVQRTWTSKQMQNHQHADPVWFSEIEKDRNL